MAINVEAFFDAINKVAKDQVDANPSDLTIDAEIASIMNVETGEYKVEYQGNIFSASALDPTVVYSRGERVYVLVPQGNFSTNKIIVGKSTYGGNTSFQDRQDMTNFYIDQGPNWVGGEEGTYPLNWNPLQICAIPSGSKLDLKHNNGDGANYEDQGFRRWPLDVEKLDRDPVTRYPVSYLSEEELAVVDHSFQNYAKASEYIKIAAKFRTEFQSEHSNGQYYLSVKFVSLNPEWVPREDPRWELRKDQPQYIPLEYRLEFSNFNGSPYQFVVDTPQKAYYPIDPGKLKGLYSVSLMQDGSLVADIRPTYDESGELVFKIENTVLEKNNIFCSDIDIRFAKKVNLLDTLYYCWIEQPQGDAVFDPDPPERPFGRAEIDLVPHFMYGMEEVTKDCEISWYREDLSIPSEISPSEEDRDKYGKVWTDYTGPGWRPVQHYIDDMNKGYALLENGILRVRKEAVKWQWRFMLVCRYKNGSFGTAICTVRRADSEYDLAIENFTGKESNNAFLRITDKNHRVGVDVDPVTQDYYPEWFGSWYYQLADNSYSDASKPYHHGPLDIQAYLIYEHVRFRVACYDPKQVCPPNGVLADAAMVQVEEIGYLDYEINSAANASLLIDWQGRKRFNYTALGKAYDSVSNKEYTLQPKLNWVHGDSSAWEITIYAPDGQVLGPRNWYNPDAVEANTALTATGTGYSASGSMMYDMWADSNNVVHFKVRQELDKDRTLNTLVARVHTIQDDQWYEAPCEVVFTKDGQQGTQGTGWTAPLKLTNHTRIRQRYYDDVAKKMIQKQDALEYTTPLGLPAYPMILKPKADGTRDMYEQDLKQTRIVMRPFVTKDGKALESLAEAGEESKHYQIKVFWDVRFPQNAKNKAARGASFLRLCNPIDGLPLPMPHTAVGAQNPEKAPGLQAVTIWDGSAAPGDKQFSDNKTYCAVELRYETGAGLDLHHEDVMFQFVVHAQIDIYSNLMSDTLERDESPGAEGFTSQTTAGTFRRIKSISSWLPVDVFIQDHTVEDAPFDPMKVYCNWPTEMTYDALGYDPIVDGDFLEFYYGYFPDSQDKTEGRLIIPENETPTVQSVEIIEQPIFLDEHTEKKLAAELNSQSLVAQPPESKYRLKPKTHLNWQEGTVGTLKGRFDGDGETTPSGWYYRNQVYSLNAYGNVDINSWNGQGIDIDEDQGTIFAPTIGAGYKGPLTNKFTGVLMGVNSGFLRDTRNSIVQYSDVDEIELKQFPYMTGLFGYQCGYSSFALLENGTAFFGRKDRGGRIIIDGYNATIYGGANGELTSPKIGDPMWNNMRLTLVDLTHATSEYGQTKKDDSISTVDKNDPEQAGNITGKEKVTTTSVQGITQGFDGAYFGDSDINDDPYGVKNKLPGWYKTMWEDGYIKGTHVLPWWFDIKDKNATAKSTLKNYFTQGEPYHNTMQNYWVDYWKPNLDAIAANNGIDTTPGKTRNLTGFGPSRASTTPAIEIGQHPTGLMPGLLPWGSVEKVFQDLFIPGDRNFMVTYDGTLWAMNGVFMGNVIGSNIIGGRIQGVQMATGEPPTDAELSDIFVIDRVCDWDHLIPPHSAPLPPEIRDQIAGAWYVDEYGNAYAKNLRLYGGSIHLGTFHILGKDDTDGTSGLGDSNIGNLVQYGESDFVGPAHFYGNVGIGPFEDGETATGQPGLRASDQGNLFQTQGVAALGIINPNFTTRFHSKFSDGGNMNGKLTYHIRGYNAPGNPGIETSTQSIEQMAIMAVNSRTKFEVTGNGGRGSDIGYQGHFWPMSFNYVNRALGQNGGPDETMSPTDAKGVHAYMTMMDIFKSKPFSIDNGVGGEELAAGKMTVDGGNYFRVGPWGVELVRAYICQEWQSQDESAAPTVNRKSKNSTAQGGVRGYVGLQNRAGGGGTVTQAIGMSSWGKAPIIFYSDENMAFRTKNWMLLGALDPNKDVAAAARVDQTEKLTGFRCALSMGSVLSESTGGGFPQITLSADETGMTEDARKGIIHVYVSNSPKGTEQPPMNGPALPMARGGLLIAPNSTYKNNIPGVYLYSKGKGGGNGDIHLVRYKENVNEACQTSKKENTEILLREEEIVCYAKDRVTIAWGGAQNAHTKREDWKHAAIFTGSGIQIIDGEDKGSYDPGTGGGGGTPPKPAQPSKKKYCIYLGKGDNVAGNSEITWMENFISVSGKQVFISGGGSPAHQPANYMHFAQNSIDMKGAYAIPDNQFHIYARFG